MTRVKALMLTGDLVEFGPTGNTFTDPGDERVEQYVSGNFGSARDEP
jgi:ABC-type phosphate transport system ATPase subunit